MAYLIHRMVFGVVARTTEPFGMFWMSVSILLCIPLVLFGGIPLQRGFDRLIGKLPPSAEGAA